MNSFVGNAGLEAWLQVMRAKLGLATEQEGDEALIEGLLERMAQNGADYTLTFRRLADAAVSEHAGAVEGSRALFADPSGFDSWAEIWTARCAEEHRSPDQRRAAMRATNPLFIPRNHLVEEALDRLRVMARVSLAAAGDADRPFLVLADGVVRAGSRADLLAVLDSLGPAAVRLDLVEAVTRAAPRSPTASFPDKLAVSASLLARLAVSASRIPSQVSDSFSFSFFVVTFGVTRCVCVCVCVCVSVLFFGLLLTCSESSRNRRYHFSFDQH